MAKKGSDSRGPSRRAAAPTQFEREFPGGSESANACAIDLVRTSGSLMAAFTPSLVAPGLSPAGREALAIIDGEGAPLSPTVIAQRLLVTTASVTSLLDTLERGGFVDRLPDPDDRRKVLVALTPAGQAAVNEFLPRIVALQTEIMASLSEDERAQLRRFLEIIRDNAATIDGAAIVSGAPKRGKPRRG